MGLAVQNEQLARRVGAIALGLLAAGFVLVFALHGVHCHGAFHADVYFERAGALKEGAPVVVAGQQIGEVESISMVSPSMAAAADHPLHPTGGVRVRVRIEDRYRWMTLANGDIFVGQRSLISPAYLELGPPPAGQAPAGPLDDDAVRLGVPPPLIDRVLQISYQNLLTSKIFLAQVRPAASRLVDSVQALGDTLDQLEVAPGDLQRLTASGRRLIDQIDGLRAKADASGVTADDLRALAGQARQTLDDATRTFADLRARVEDLSGDTRRLRDQVPAGLPDRLDQARGRVVASLVQLEQITATLREMAAMVERGDGNIGGLIHDPEWADHAKEIGKMLKRQPWKLFGTDRGKRPVGP